MLNDIMLNDIMLNDIMLNDIMLNDDSDFCTAVGLIAPNKRQATHSLTR